MSKREFSKISPTVWRSGRFTAQDADAMVLHLYFMTCEHQNSAGCFRLPDGYACADLGWEPKKYVRCREQLTNAGLVRLENETCEVFVHRWFKHNPPMNDKHTQGTRFIIERIESDDIREKVGAEFQEVDEQRLTKSKQSDPSISNPSYLAQTRIMQRGRG